MRAVLDDGREPLEGLHGCPGAERVHSNDRRGPPAGDGLGGGRIEVPGPRRDIGRQRRCAARERCRGERPARIRGDDHALPRRDAERPQREPQRCEARADTDAVAAAGALREASLQLAHARPGRPAAARDCGGGGDRLGRAVREAVVWDRRVALETEQENMPVRHLLVRDEAGAAEGVEAPQVVGPDAREDRGGAPQRERLRARLPQGLDATSTARPLREQVDRYLAALVVLPLEAHLPDRLVPNLDEQEHALIAVQRALEPGAMLLPLDGAPRQSQPNDVRAVAPLEDEVGVLGAGVPQPHLGVLVRRLVAHGSLHVRATACRRSGRRASPLIR